jgi:predicted amidophosphoribosyltransferase
VASIALALAQLKPPVILVPIPNSSCVRPDDTPKTRLLADAIAANETSMVVCDALRWKKPMKPAHRGGTREAEELYDKLVLIKRLPPGTRILVDDVVTKGSHILAGAKAISEAGNRCVEAICVGRTVSYPISPSFQLMRFKLRDLNLSHDEKVSSHLVSCAAD